MSGTPRSSPARGGGPRRAAAWWRGLASRTAPGSEPPSPACGWSPSPYWGGFWLALLLASPAQAESPVVVSSFADELSVTIYRDPDRSFGGIDADWPGAFALIAETRTVTLPPGEVTVRFEGVASGIVPQSAILFGSDPRERNRDAALLSQRGLVDAFTGQRVTLRRTDPATGKMVEEPATIRSAADRLVVTTPRGIEAMYCSGLNQTLIYPNAPAGLSAKPVLSMLTKDQPGGRVTVTLAYIATGFDWDATYIGTLDPDGKSLSLLGWMTMASGDDTSFPDATTAAVGGRINRSNDTRDQTGRQVVNAARFLDRSYGCWPSLTTSDHAPPPAPPPMAMAMGGEDIIVTAQRRQEMVADVPVKLAVTAQAENLGDLKLYRIPVPVTVAARSQKQVAFMAKPRIAGEMVYNATLNWNEVGQPKMLFRFQNRARSGLGEALPAGKAVMFQQSAFGRMYVGETWTIDKAVNEEVELAFGEASGVTTELTVKEIEGERTRYENALVVRNANPFPVVFEGDFLAGGPYQYTKVSGKLRDKAWKRVWRVTIPANGSERLTYRADERPDEDE